MREMTMQVLNYDLSIKNMMYIYIHTPVIPLPLFLSLYIYTYNSDLASVAYCMSKLSQRPSIDDRHWHVSEVVHEQKFQTW